MAPYQYFDHTAEVGILAHGVTLAEAFASAADGLIALLYEPAEVKEREECSLQVSSPDLEALLVDWLNEINYQVEVHGFAFRRFLIQELTDQHLRASGVGEPLDPDRHHAKEQIKAATYHALEVRQESEGYRINVILDI